MIGCFGLPACIRRVRGVTKNAPSVKLHLRLRIRRHACRYLSCFVYQSMQYMRWPLGRRALFHLHGCLSRLVLHKLHPVATAVSIHLLFVVTTESSIRLARRYISVDSPRRCPEGLKQRFRPKISLLFKGRGHRDPLRHDFIPNGPTAPEHLAHRSSN